MKINFHLFEPYIGGITILSFGKRYDRGVWLSFNRPLRRFHFRRDGYMAIGPLSIRWGD